MAKIFLMLALAVSCISPAASKPTLSVPQQLWVDSNGSKVFCQKMGQGKPLVVLHGGPGLSQDYLLPHLWKSEPASSEDLALFIAGWTQRTSPYQKEVAELKETDQFQQGDSDLHEKINQLFLQTYCHAPPNVSGLNLRMNPVAAVNCTKINQLFWKNGLGKPFDLHKSLKRIRVPKLVVQGDDDVIPAATAKRIHQSILGSRFVALKDCGHFPYVEQPEEYFSAL